MLMLPGIEIGLAKTQAESFCQGIPLGKVIIQMLNGQRASSVECGAERQTSKGTLFLLSGEEESRLRGHSASPRGRNEDKMGRERVDSKLEWNQQPLRETVPFTPSILWLWWSPRHGSGYTDAEGGEEDQN